MRGENKFLAVQSMMTKKERKKCKGREKNNSSDREKST
jgi:hypothetical protein